MFVCLHNRIGSNSNKSILGKFILCPFGYSLLTHELEKEKSKKLKTAKPDLVGGLAKVDRSKKNSKDTLNQGDGNAAKENLENVLSNVKKGEPDELPNISEHYQVLKLIGEGGMGSVYEVRDLEHDEIVAVKVLQSNLTDDKAALKRFEQEAQAAQNLSHPNLGATYKHGLTVDGAPYIVLDYYEGKSLSEIIKDEGVLDSKRTLNLITQICEGLKHAHDNGVIHRDLKPNNIIVSRTDDGGEIARIVDFGIAKVTPKENRETHNLTETGEVFGSPHYMSPEQCLGFMLDNRSDVYSLGCMMYEMLNGEPPYGGANPIQVVVKHINEEVSGFSETTNLDKKGRGLETITLRCLEKELENRYPSVGDLIKDLTLVTDDKQPTRYKKKYKQKREFTKRQLIGIIVGVAALIFYTAISAAFFQQMQFLFIMMYGVLNLLIIGGMYVSFGSLVELVKKVEDLKSSSTSWWQMSLGLSFGAVCATVFPYILIGGAYSYFCQAFGKQKWEFPEWSIYAGFFDLYAHLIAIFVVIVSLVGLCILGGKARIGIGNFLIRFFTVAASIVVLSTMVFPKPVSRVCGAVAYISGDVAPPVTSTFAHMAFNLNRTDKSIGKSAAKADIKLDKPVEARNFLQNPENFPKTNTDYEIYEIVVQSYLKQKDYAGALAYANKHVGNYKNWNRARALAGRGKIYEAMNQYGKALADYNKVLVLHPKEGEYIVDKIRMLTALNRTAQLDNYLDKLLQSKDSFYGSGEQIKLFAAMAKQRQGDIAGAEKLFKEIAGKFYPAYSRYAYYEHNFAKNEQRKKWAKLYNAYTYNQIGNEKLAKRFLDKASPLGKKDLANSPLIQGTGLDPQWK